mgnify:CR=1 FL=1
MQGTTRSRVYQLALVVLHGLVVLSILGLALLGQMPGETAGWLVPPGDVRTLAATMEEAWAALNEAQTGKPAEAIEKTWFDTIARLFPNKSNTDLKPHEWGKLKAEFEDNIPM